MGVTATGPFERIALAMPTFALGNVPYDVALPASSTHAIRSPHPCSNLLAEVKVAKFVRGGSLT